MIDNSGKPRIIRVPLQFCVLGEGHVCGFDIDGVMHYYNLLEDNPDKEHDLLKVKEIAPGIYEVVRGAHRWLSGLLAGREYQWAYLVEGEESSQQ